MSPSRILVVDDHEQFRQLVCSLLRKSAEFQIVGEASDGLEAIQKAETLHPDLILLDIHLPKLNGIEVVIRLRTVAPHTKILVLSQETSPDVVEEALSLGALGYVHKIRVANELLPAVKAVLAGKEFVGGGLKRPQTPE